MSEFRKDPIVGRWVIVASNRADRPNAFLSPTRWQPAANCPFCEGHESQTPGEVLAYRDDPAQRDGTGWRVRVFENKYPALETEGEVRRWTDGIYDLSHGVGAHEVIVESPQHLSSTSQLSQGQLAEVFSAYRERLAHWSRDPRLRFGMIFKNAGPDAGASIEHGHSQLIVTPIVPVAIWEEMTGALEFYHRCGSCAFCRMVSQELDLRRRIVLETPRHLAFLPFAGRFPYETWVLPKAHAGHYESASADDLADLAGVMRQVIGGIEKALDRPAYNYMLHTAPFDTSEPVHYHWHIEIIPSLTKPAGFEWGSGFYVNPVPPEDAAAVLRAAIAL